MEVNRCSNCGSYFYGDYCHECGNVNESLEKDSTLNLHKVIREDTNASNTRRD